MSLILFLVVNVFNSLLLIFVYPKFHYLVKYTGMLIYFLQVLSQTYTTLRNPGIPHRNNYVSDTIMHTIYQNIRYNNYKFDKYRICKACNILVNTDQKVTHCEECNICYEGNRIQIKI